MASSRACVVQPMLHEIRQRHAADRRIAHHRHHVVAVAAERHRAHVLDRHVEFVGKEVAEARAIEHARHADHHVLGQAAALLQRPHHGVERIGDADDKRVRRILLDAGADLIHHLKIDAEQVIAAHARLARHAGGDDAHVGALDAVIRIRAREFRVEALDRGGLRDVERLALRDALHDVEHHDIAEFFQADQMSERAADLAGADQCNFLARHCGENLG